MTDLLRQKQKLLSLANVSVAADIENGQLINEEAIRATVHDLSAHVGHPPQQVVDDVIEELTRRHNVWTGKGAALIGQDANHQAWLSGRRATVEWRFWERYFQFMERRLPKPVAMELDESTDLVLGLLEDPLRAGQWRRQGLVVGHVQSGKTGNYTGLICKAADAGYKVIVVLAGIHNSLRSQTQMRLDEGFLGYARNFGNLQNGRVPIGVGTIDPLPLADSVTTRDELGDFSRTKAQGFQIHAGGKALLFVVKKNVRVLNNLIEWARLSARKQISENRFVVGDAALLLVDDEADQASISTRVQAIDADTGMIDKDHEPTAINRAIRKLLETFEKRAYVGYTATPFANVFIHPMGATDEGGDDLYPKDFIVNLSAPSDYFGPARIFGRGTDSEVLPTQGAVPSRIRFVDDADGWVPPSHKNNLQPRYGNARRVPPSLENAIRAFVLASAARRVRGQAADHKSMLVHVTRFTAVQEEVHRQVQSVVDNLRTRWRARNAGGDSLLVELEAQWQDDFVRTSDSHSSTAPSWPSVSEQIHEILKLVRVNLINAKASDALIYEEHKRDGLHVIAVGGDKLSRGLTLEGLTVSYFLRSSRMYDTLMQMGRWFGYRHGYDDLCRLYLSEELAEWYAHITDAAEELRQEFDRMVLLGGTPNDYGLRVREHPVLAITGKLRPGTPSLPMSLSATPFEPTILRDDTNTVDANWAAAGHLIDKLGAPHQHPILFEDTDQENRRRNLPGGMLWRSVDGNRILEFMREFEFADNQLTKTPGIAVRNYIADRMSSGELTNWTLVVIGKGEEKTIKSDHGTPTFPVTVNGISVFTLFRDHRSAEGLFRTRRIGSPGDEAIDLSNEQWRQVRERLRSASDDPQRAKDWTSGRVIRDVREPTHGLMILYLLTPSKESVSYRNKIPLVAPYLSFPNSLTAKAVSYALTFRYWEDEIKGVE